MWNFKSGFAVGMYFIALAIYLNHLLKSDRNVVLKIAQFVHELDNATDFNNKFNRYLSGVYAPVDEENFNLPAEVLSGAVPSDVRGLFLRIGPNPKAEHNNKRYHWFDGDGMIHSLRIRGNGKYDESADGDGDGHEGAEVVYSNQWVRTPRFKLEEENGMGLFVRIGEIKGLVGLIKILVVQPLISRLFTTRKVESGTANTAMVLYDSKIYACHEGSLPFQVQWTENNSFISVGYESLGGKLDHPVTAHSRVDPEDGGWYFNGYNLEGPGAGMKFGRYGIVEPSSSSRNKDLLAYFSIPEPVKSFAHDMMITRNYVLFFESSVIFDTAGIMQGNFFRFDDQHSMRIGVMPKNGTSVEDVTWFVADRAYSIIHAMNAWEAREAPSVTMEGNDDNVDIYSSKEIVLFAHLGTNFDALDPEGTVDDNEFYLSEIRLDLEAGKMKVQLLHTEILTEFPNIHPAFLGRPSQFGYSGQFFRGSNGFTRLVKWDLFRKEVVAVIKLPEGLSCGEPVAIPKGPRSEGPPNTASTTGTAVQEGQLSSDGVYLGVMAYNTATHRGEWLLYDGASMDQEPVVRLALGGKRVPAGFHGMWVPEQQLQSHLQLSSQYQQQ